jgi:HlyD family secretion protein
MTATVSVVTDRRRDVLAIPNAALRFRPDAAGGGPGSREGRSGTGGAQNFGAGGGGGPGAGGARQRGQGGGPGGEGNWRGDRGGENEESGPPQAQKRTVYVLVNGEPVARELTTGITDGRVTEVVDGDLKEGENVIVSIAGQNPNQQQRGPQGQRGGFRIL